MALPSLQFFFLLSYLNVQVYASKFVAIIRFGYMICAPCIPLHVRTAIPGKNQSLNEIKSEKRFLSA